MRFFQLAVFLGALIMPYERINSVVQNGLSACLENGDLDIHLRGETVQWKTYLLTGHPDRRKGLVFIHAGKPFTGCVRLTDGPYEPVVEGWVTNGSMSGDWKATDTLLSVITKVQLRPTLPGSDVVSIFRTRHDKLDYELERLNDTLALIREWAPDYLYRICLASHPTQSGSLVYWAQEYYPDGSFRRYTYRDSVDIEWIRDDKEWNMPGRGCHGGIKAHCVTIVNGMPEQCLVQLNGWDRVKYMGRDYQGHYYPLGTFVHFDKYGKPDTVRVELDVDKLKPHVLAGLPPLK